MYAQAELEGRPLFAGPPLKTKVEIETVSHGDPVSLVEAQPASDSAQTAQEPLLEVLYWVGCLGSFDHATRGSAQSLAGSSKRQSEVRYHGQRRVLLRRPGPKTGERVSVPDAGPGQYRDHEHLGVRKVITSCPHCFNTIKNEYPEFGGNYDVVHHSEFLDFLIK